MIYLELNEVLGLHDRLIAQAFGEWVRRHLTARK